MTECHSVSFSFVLACCLVFSRLFLSSVLNSVDSPHWECDFFARSDSRSAHTDHTRTTTTPKGKEKKKDLEDTEQRARGREGAQGRRVTISIISMGQKSPAIYGVHVWDSRTGGQTWWMRSHCGLIVVRCAHRWRRRWFIIIVIIVLSGMHTRCRRRRCR